MADAALAAPVVPGRQCISLSAALCTGGVEPAPLKPGMIPPSPCKRPPSVNEKAPSLLDEVSKANKGGFQPYHARMVPKLIDLQACANENKANGIAVTTLMLRNIPNKYAQNTLMREINALGFESSYDFFYLPMDVHNRSNVGYAFINFIDEAETKRFRATFSSHEFERFKSRKVASICNAHLQGLDANIHHFQHRAVALARNDQYLPAVFRDQKRVKFEDAVAELLQRMPASAATNKEFFSGEMDSVYFAPDVAMPRLRLEDNAKEPNRTRSIDHMRREAGSKDDFAERAPAPLHSARRGLEDAIRVLLTQKSLLSDPPASVVPETPLLASPAASSASARSMPECFDDDSSYENPCQDFDAGDDDDVMQLLSLRKLLVNRLLESAKGPP